jgi:hypothetical protein
MRAGHDAPNPPFNLENDHAPWSTGGLERPLRVVKNSLFDRRFALRNPDRLAHLLVLFQLAQIGLADAHQWAHVLHDQNLLYQGAPPPRRSVDRPELYPGLRGGRQGLRRIDRGSTFTTPASLGASELQPDTRRSNSELEC